MVVKGSWLDKTIQEAEDIAVNVVQQVAYSGSPQVRLGWKGVVAGSLNLTFILLESVIEKTLVSVPTSTCQDQLQYNFNEGVANLKL